jgi:hypothetical protein
MLNFSDGFFDGFDDCIFVFHNVFNIQVTFDIERIVMISSAGTIGVSNEFNLSSSEFLKVSGISVRESFSVVTG